MAKRKSTVRTTLAATALMALFAVVVPWSCQLDTSPRILPHPPVNNTEPDDSDSGEERVS